MSNSKLSQSNIGVSSVTPETRRLVEQSIPAASADVQKKTMELMDAIKKQTKLILKKTDEWSQSEYKKVAQKVEAEVSSMEDVFDEYGTHLQESMNLISQEADRDWESVTEQVSRIGSQLQEASEAAWSILTRESNEKQSDGKLPQH